MADIKDFKLSNSEEILHLKDEPARERIDTLEAWVADAVDLFYPVGSVIINFGEDPSTRFTGTRWERIGQGRAIVGVKDTDSYMNVAGDTFGTSETAVPYHRHSVSNGSHTHSLNAHTHGKGSLTGRYKTRTKDNESTAHHGALSFGFTSFDMWSDAGAVEISGSTGAASGDTGGATGFNTDYAGNNSSTHTNYPPSIALCIWKRVDVT